jgi:cytidylate kinase
MPIITVSRMFGSGGSQVAQRVADALGWDLLDNAVVDAVAARLGLTVAEVSAHEERVPSLVERLATAMMLSAPEILPVVDVPTPQTEERIVAVTRSVIQDAVRRGPAVVVGRGAQCLLADRPDALHVYCHGAPRALAEFVVHEKGVSRDEAARLVETTNRQREQYVRRHWNREWRAVENYDLCLNTGTLGVDGAARVVIDVAITRFS